MRDARQTSLATEATPESPTSSIKHVQLVEARSVHRESSCTGSVSPKAAPVNSEPGRPTHAARREAASAAKDASIAQDRQRTHLPVTNTAQIVTTKRPCNYPNISVAEQRENLAIPGLACKLTNKRAGITNVPQYPLQPSSTAFACSEIEGSQRQGEPPTMAYQNYGQASEYLFNPSNAERILDNSKSRVALRTEISHHLQVAHDPRSLSGSLPGSPIKKTKRTRQQTKPYRHLQHRALLGSEFPLRPSDAETGQSTTSLQNMTSRCKCYIHPSWRLPECTAWLLFSRSARIVRRSRGTSDILYPADNLMSQSSTGFYRWYASELRVNLTIPVLKFVLPSVSWSKQREFLVAADNESQFQQLKQAIWDTWISAFFADQTDPFHIAIELVPFMQNGGLDAWVPKGNNITPTSLGGLFLGIKSMDEDMFAGRQTGTGHTADMWALRAPMPHRIAALPFADNAVGSGTPSTAQAYLETAAPTSTDIHPTRSEHGKRESTDGAAKLVRLYVCKSFFIGFDSHRSLAKLYNSTTR
jgi:hypothetical protein